MVTFDLNPGGNVMTEHEEVAGHCTHVMSSTTVAVMFLMHRWDHLRTLNRAMDCLLDIVLTHDALCSFEDGSDRRECFACATVLEFNPVEAVECLALNREALQHEFGKDACRPLDRVVYDVEMAFSLDLVDMAMDDFGQSLMERCVDELSLVHGLHTVLRGVIADDHEARRRFEDLLAELRTGSALNGEEFFRNELISDHDDRCWLLDRGWSSYRLHCQIMTAMEAYLRDDTVMPDE